MRLSQKREGLPCEMASGKTGNLHGKSEGLSDGTDGSYKGSSHALPRGKWTGFTGKRAGDVSEKSTGALEQDSALGKLWGNPEILRAAGFSLPDMDFSGNGMTHCQVSMVDFMGSSTGNGLMRRGEEKASEEKK